MNRYSIIFISFFFLYNSCSQEKHAPVYSNEKIYPDSSPGYEISYLFKLIGDSVFNAERKLIRIGMPANIKAGSAWGSFNIGGFKTAKTKWEVFYIITDFDSTTPQIIFDKNGNADFRDDTAFAIQPVVVLLPAG